MTETLDRVSLIFQYQNDNRFVFSNINSNANNSQLYMFADSFNSLQKSIAHTFVKEERFLLAATE